MDAQTAQQRKDEQFFLSVTRNHFCVAEESGLQRLPAHPLITSSTTPRKIDFPDSLPPGSVFPVSARRVLKESGAAHRGHGESLRSETVRRAVRQSRGGHRCPPPAEGRFPVCCSWWGSAGPGVKCGQFKRTNVQGKEFGSAALVCMKLPLDFPTASQACG